MHWFPKFLTQLQYSQNNAICTRKYLRAIISKHISPHIMYIHTRQISRGRMNEGIVRGGSNMRYDTKCTKRIVRAHKESARAERKREAGRGEKKKWGERDKKNLCENENYKEATVQKEGSVKSVPTFITRLSYPCIFSHISLSLTPGIRVSRSCAPLPSLYRRK